MLPAFTPPGEPAPRWPSHWGHRSGRLASRTHPGQDNLIGEAMAKEARHAYDTSFFESLSPISQESARAVVPLVDKLVRPASVLDVGCGTGTWLAEWISRDVTDVVGLDGDHIDKAIIQITPSKFVPTDLRNGFSLGRKFDLVQCLETAEHIEEDYADLLVESIASHGDVILFSAAVPGQGGVHHVNEQWPSYWVEKFSRAGFKMFDVMRPLIWTDSRIAGWYRQSMLIFSRKRTFDSGGTCVDFVHPELWLAGIDYRAHPRELVRSLPGALSLVLRREFRRLSGRPGR